MSSNDNDDESVTSYDSGPPAKRFKCDICNRKFSRRYSMRRHVNSVHANESSEEETEEDSEAEEMEEEGDSEEKTDAESEEETEAESEEETEELDSEEETEELDSEEEKSSDSEEDKDSLKSTGESDEESSEDEEDKEKHYITNMFRKIACKTIKLHEEELDDLMGKEEDEDMENKDCLKRKKQMTISAIQNSSSAKKTLRRLFVKNVINVHQERNHPLYKAIMKKAKELMDNEDFELDEAINAAVSYRKHAIYNLLEYL